MTLIRDTAQYLPIPRINKMSRLLLHKIVDLPSYIPFAILGGQQRYIDDGNRFLATMAAFFLLSHCSPADEQPLGTAFAAAVVIVAHVGIQNPAVPGY